MIDDKAMIYLHSGNTGNTGVTVLTNNLDKVEYRFAVRDDVPELIRMIVDDALGATRDVFADPLPDIYWQAWDKMEHQGFNKIIVATIGGKIVGCLTLTLITGLGRMGMTRAQIESVRVDTPLRGQGIGERLMRHAIAMAQEMGCGLVQLTTDNTRPDAHRFYENMGFVASHVGMKLILEQKQ